MSFYQNGILISGVNTLPELTRAQYEALPADKRPEYWVCLDEEYEPASGGHTIEDTNATTMPQEENLQFVGLEVTDDSTNGKTIVDATDKVTWEANGVLGAKNLIPYPYYESDHTESGITWTVNSDGSITANGTATANSTFILRYRKEQTKFVEKNTSYLLSGCPSGGSNSKYSLSFFVKNQDDSNIASGVDFGNGKIINMPNQDYYGIYAIARVFSGQTVSNLTFKPMLRLAEDTDNTYQPYARTNKQLTDDVKDVWKANGVLGAKQLIPYPYYETTKTTNGTTYIDNGDGSVTLSTVSGGATANNALFLRSYAQGLNGISFKKNKRYTLSGISGGSATTYQLFVATFLGSTQKEIWYTTDGDMTFIPTQDFDGVNIYARVVKDAVITTPVTLYPMLRLASDTDSTYQPYAKTNQQLTKDKTEKTDIATVESGTTASRAYSVGELVYVSGTLYRVKTAIASGATFTVGTNIEVANVSSAVITEINSVNAFMPIFGTTKGRGQIDNALHVDLNVADGSANQVGYVYTGYSTNIPQNMVVGTREVYYYNPTGVFVKLTGADTSDTYSEWGNYFNGTTWSGWKKICGGSVTLLVVNPITSADNNYTVTGGDIKEFSKLNLQILAGADKSASSILIDTDGLMEGKTYRVTFTDGTNDVYAELVKVSDTVMKIQANPRLIELQWGIALVGLA